MSKRRGLQHGFLIMLEANGLEIAAEQLIGT
jgi:hypothetical protein